MVEVPHGALFSSIQSLRKAEEGSLKVRVGGATAS